MAVVLATLFLTHWALAIAVMGSAEFFAERTNTVTVVLAASLIAHRADADVAMVAAKLVLSRHWSILSSYANSIAMIGGKCAQSQHRDRGLNVYRSSLGREVAIAYTIRHFQSGFDAGAAFQHYRCERKH